MTTQIASRESTRGVNASLIGAVLVGRLTRSSVATGVAFGTAGVGSGSTSVSKPAGAADWTAGDLVGKFLHVMSGGGFVGDLPVLRPILSNTTTALTVNEVAGMDATSVFEVVDLEAASAGIAAADVDGPVDIAGFSFGASITDASMVRLADCSRVRLTGCSFDTSAVGPSVSAVRVARLEFSHCRLTNGADVSVVECANVEVRGIDNAAGGVIAVADASKCVVAKLSAVGAPASVLRLQRVQSATVEVAASGGAATPIHLEDANVEVAGAGLAGSGNTGYGVEIAGAGAYAYGLTGSTITGSSGDVFLFDRAVPWAMLAGGSGEIGVRFGWRDLEGDVSLKTGGAGQPALDELFVGATFQVPFFQANDIASFAFHMPHDWVKGSDLYLHVHWTHNGTAISGSLVNSFEVSYSKGHNQENFPAPFTVVQTIPAPNIATMPRYRHRIDEFQLSSATPTGTQLDSNALEVDGLILCSIKPTTIPTITGGTPNQPAILFVDIHYLSNSLGTVNKAPNFYAS